MRSLSFADDRLPKFIVPSAMAGGLFAIRLGIGLLVVITFVLLPRTAATHTLGLSVSEFDVMPDGTVDARFTFASAEFVAFVGMDRDNDGVVTDSEVAGARAELSAFLARGVGVDTGNSPCGATFLGASLTEIDGLVLQARYVCPSDAEAIEVTLYYLSVLPLAHREIARIVAADAIIEQILTGEHRAIALRLPNGPGGLAASLPKHGPFDALRRLERRPLVAATMFASSSVLAFIFYRRRAARRKRSSRVDLPSRGTTK